MKKNTKLLALLLAVLLCITVFSFAALGEENGESSAPGDESSEAGGESSDPGTGESSEAGGEQSSEPQPDPNAYTVNINISGAAEVYFNNEKFEGAAFQGSADGSALSIKIAPTAESELLAVNFSGIGQPVIEGSCSFNILPEAGASYNLRIDTKLLPKKVSLSVDTKGVLSKTVYVNGSELTEGTQIFAGDTVKVHFEIPEEFDPSKASFTVNGATAEISSADYEFVISENTTLFLAYGVVPVTFIIIGPGTLELTDVGEITNTSSGTLEKTFYFTQNGQYSCKPTPAMNYILSGIVEITEPNRAEENGVYYFRPSGPTTVTARFVASSQPPTPTETFNVRVNVGTGGTATAGGQTVIGGTGTIVQVFKGDSLSFTATPDSGYLIDVFRVNGTAVTLQGNTYTLSNISADTSVSVLFKSEAPPAVNSGISASDIIWEGESIVVDISGNKQVMRDVFTKIASLEPGSGKFVAFESEGGIFYIPYGAKLSGDFESVNLSISVLKSGALLESIQNAVKAASEAEIIYIPFTFNPGVELPEGTMVAFKLDDRFVGNSAVMLLYDSANAKFFTKENAPDALGVDADKLSGKYFYNNEGVVIVSKDIPGEFVINATAVNGGGYISPEGNNRVALNSDCKFVIIADAGYAVKQILVDGKPMEGVEGLQKYEFTFEKVGANHDIKVEFMSTGAVSQTKEEESGNGTLIVVIIVVFVAVAGAAALFIVKWRQEKF